MSKGDFMRHNTRCWDRWAVLAVAVGGFLGAMYMGCGSSGTATGSTSGVAISGTANVPSDASASESAPLGKSLSKAVGSSNEVSADVTSLAKDTAVGVGKTVTCTDAITGKELDTAKTDSSGAYTLDIPTTATDVIISVKVDDETEINRFYTANGVATGVTVDADTSSAMIAVFQECQDKIGATNVAISDFATKCGAAMTAGNLNVDAIYAPALALGRIGVAEGSPDASTGKGSMGAQFLSFREILSSKLKGNASDLKGQDPFDVMRKAYLSAEPTALANFAKYAPVVTAIVPPATAFAFAKSVAGSMNAVNNDGTSYATVKGDPTAIATFFGSTDAASAAKFLANPADVRSQFKTVFDSSATDTAAKDKLKDPKYFTFIADAVGDPVYSKLPTQAERDAHANLWLKMDVTGKTAAEIKTISAGTINTVGAACPAGTCDATKLLGIKNNPTVYTASILSQPTLYGGATGTTFVAGLINQLGTTEVITGTKPTFTACSTASDCGTVAGATLICINSFCQNSTVVKALGESCTYNGDCASGTCDTATGSTTKICKEPAVALGGTGGTFKDLLGADSPCLEGPQCKSGFCDLNVHQCKATTTITPIEGGIKLGGLYRKGSTPSNILAIGLNVTPISGSTVSVALSDGLYGHTESATYSSGKLSFTITNINDAGTLKTLTCTNVDVLSDGALLSGTDVCTLGSTAKSINHTKL